MNKEVVILIAEDDEGHFILTKKYLKSRGVRNEIKWFADGKEAVDFFFDEEGNSRGRNGRLYILLLDLKMPIIDGMGVLEKIQTSPKLADMPVIVLTASDNPAVIESAYEAGAKAYIIKPVKYSSYIDAMRKVGLFPTVIENGVVLRRQSRELLHHARPGSDWRE